MMEELRHSFMNVVVAAAKRFEIEPFLSMQVPTYKNYRNTTDHREFKAELDHYVTQLILDNSFRKRSDFVAILPDTKHKIRNYLGALRECIEKSSMSDAKRETLLKKLDEFETELEKRRINLLAAARLAFELLAVPGAVWASYEVASKLVHNVLQTVAEAKSAEQETHQIAPVAPPRVLSPPRVEPTGRKGQGRTTDVIDDDIPF